MSESGRGEERREREERKRRGEKEERREEESDGESLYKRHKHNRQKGQRELVLTVIIIKLSVTWCRRACARMCTIVLIYSP